MTTSHPLHADDLAGIQRWFEQLVECVNQLDYAAGRELVTTDFVAFGTYADLLRGIDQAEQEQWRNVWSTIQGFRIRLDQTEGFSSPDRLFAVGITFFDSIGYREDGSTFDRTGRVTVTFTRKHIGDPWLANHSHMSLLRGTPATSHKPQN